MFEDRLKNLRKSRGLSQLELANYLGLKTRTYVSYENNEREPDSQVLIRIAQFFDVSIDYLLNFNVESQISTPSVTKKELQVLQAYRNQPDMQKSVDRLLGITEQSQIVQNIKPVIPEVEKPKPVPYVARDLTGQNTKGVLHLTQADLDFLEANKIQPGEDTDL